MPHITRLKKKLKHKQPLSRHEITRHERSIYPFSSFQDVSPFLACLSITTISQKLRLFKRIGCVLGFTFLSIPLQSIFLKIPGGLKTDFVCIYWAGITKLFGVKLRRFQHPHAAYLSSKTYRSTADRRPILYISNHVSWLDIAIIGGVTPGCFLAKQEVGTWPLISTLCKLGRVIFTSRQRQSAAKEQLAMQERLKNGDNLILFPEGTTSDGSHLLPFMSAFFVIAKQTGKNQIDYNTPIIQPISLVYDRMNMLPVTRYKRAIYSWYGDMELVPHLCEIGRLADIRASIIFHEPIDPNDFKNRKDLAKTTWDIIARGTTGLRQSLPEAEINKLI